MCVCVSVCLCVKIIFVKHPFSEIKDFIILHYVFEMKLVPQCNESLGKKYLFSLISGKAILS